MVAVVSGSGLGLFGSSVSMLGGAGAAGNAVVGRGRDRVYVNAATGNLVIQSVDETLSALGLDLALVRTYNSQGLLDDDNGDNWRLGVHQRVHGLTGTLNTTDSTVRKVFGDGREVVYTYDSTLSAYVSTEGDGAHDTLKNVSGTWTWTDGSGRNTETYNSSGQLTHSRDADGNAITYTYNGSGLLTQIADASGQTTYLDYSGTNLTQIRVVSNGVTQTLTRYTYDASNRLSQVRVDLTPGDNSIADNVVYTTTYTYDGSSKRIASITQSDGSSISFTYTTLNGQSRLASYVVTNADGGNRTTTFSYSNYNSGGAVYLQTNVTDSLGLVSTYNQDSAGRLTSTLSPTVGGVRLETRYAYDASGNVTTITEDPNGLNRVTTNTYDSRGNLLTSRDSLGNTIERTYNANNQVLTEVRYLVRDPDGAGSGTPSSPLTTRFVYDAENHLRFSISADGRVTEHRCNAAGQRTLTLTYIGALYTATPFAESDLSTWAAAQNQTLLERVEYAYDFRGNLTTLTAWSATTSTGAGSGTASITRFVYDQRGQLLQTIDPRGEATTGDPNDYRTTYTYDGLGRVLTTTQWLSGTASRTTTVAYDDANRRITTTAANGLITTQTFNQAGELIGVAHGASGALGTTIYKYDAGGRLRMMQDATGVRQFALYDEAGRKIAEVDGDGTLTEFIYDRADQLIKTIQYAVRLPAATLASLVDGSGNPTNVALSTLRTAAGGSPAQDRITRNVYDAAGLLVYTIDEIGAVTQFIYDGGGRVTDTVRYANPVTIARSVDQVLPGSFTITTSANDRRTRNLYNGDNQLVGTLDAGGYLVEYVYDGAGRLAQQIAYANQSPSAHWLTGTLAQLRPALDNETTIDPERDSNTYFFYDGQGRAVGMLDGEGYLTEKVYDVAGNVSQEIRYDRVLTYTPGTSTFATLKSAANGATTRVTAYQYDGAGRVVQHTNYEGTITTLAYDAADNVIATTAAATTSEARTTEARYDFLGRVIQELTAEGRALITGSSTPAQIEDIWNRYGITYAYDLAGRRISATTRPNDSQTNVTRYYYDSDNRLRFEVNQLGERIEYRYNALGQLTEQIKYLNRISVTGLTGGLLTDSLITTLTASASATGDARTTYTYTLTGRVASKVTAENASVTYTYNAFGEEIAKVEQIDASRSLRTEYTYDLRGLLALTRWDPLGLNTTESNQYDAFGRLTRVTDARGNMQRIEYDRLGRVIATVDALGARRVTTYDGFSRTLTTIDALNNTTTYSYSDTTRTMTMTTPEGIAVVTTRNRHGETLTVTAAGRTTTYTYNRDGLLTGASDNLGSLESRTYDRMGRQLTATDARGVVTTFTYDAANRVLTRTVDSGGLALTTTYTYDGMGRVTRVQEPNGRITDTSYDRDGRVTLIAVDPNGHNLRTAYTYDRQGHVLTVTEGYGVPDEARVTQYTYDNLGRRTQEVVDPGSGNKLNITTQYKYDANGNLTRKIDARGYSTWFVYDADNRLTHTVDALGGVTETTYDDEGRVRTVRQYANPVPTGSFGDAVTSVSVQLSTADRITQSFYDKDGREIYTVDAAGGVVQRTFDANGNVTRTRAFANAVPVAVYTSTSQLTTALTAAGNNISTLAANDRVTWKVYDLRGRAAFSINGLGAVVQYQYDGNDNVTAITAFATLRSTSAATDLASVTSWASSNASNTQNRTTRYWYDNTNRLRFTVDAEGYLQESRYNDAGRLQTAIVYAAKPTIASGATLAQVTSAAAAIANASNDQSTTTLYDAAGRVSRITDALGGYEEFTYDAVGNKKTYRNAKGSVWSYKYDANGRLLEEISPQVAVTTITESTSSLSSSQVTASVVTRMTYDALGNVKTRTEGILRFANNPDDVSRSRTTSYDYDELGRQIRTTFPPVGVYNPAAGDSQAGNGAAINRTEIATGSGGVPNLYTEVAYDTLGNAFRNRDVAGNYSFKVYDVLGRVQYEVDAENQVTRYSYDAFGNQVSLVRYANALSSALPTSTASLTAADVTSRLTTSSSTDRTITTTYDRLDRVVQVTQPSVFNFEAASGTNPGGTSFNAAPTTLTEYNAFGQVIRTRRLVTAGNYADTYFYYDRRGLKTAEVDALGYLTTYQYDETGDLIGQTEYANRIPRWDLSGYWTFEQSALTYTENASDVHVSGTVRLVGDTATKVSGGDEWGASGFRSKIGYTGGATVSFVPAQNNKYLMVGLNSDPTSDHSYTSIDYAMYASADGNLYAYESGAQVASMGAYSAGDVLSVSYDGTKVRYLKNGVVLRTVTVSISAPLYADASFYSVGGKITDIDFHQGTYADGVIVLRDTARKVAGSDAWSAGFRSKVGYIGGAAVSFVPSQNDKYLMVGLNSDPAADNSYTSIDYAMYASADGNLYAYESGVQAASMGAYAAGDVLSVIYDGSTVKYLKNGVVLRSVAANISVPLYADSSFHSVGGEITNLQFGRSAADRVTTFSYDKLNRKVSETTFVNGDGGLTREAVTTTYATTQSVTWSGRPRTARARTRTTTCWDVLRRSRSRRGIAATARASRRSP